eukprot:COSAG02_NODE_30556_length_549_cov_0.568889_1_plen_113_part_01
MAAIGIARGKAPGRGGLGEGARAKVRARWFGDDWAKETFGKTWTTAWCHGVVLGEAGYHEWQVRFDGDPQDYTATTRDLQVDKNREAARLAALPVEDGGTGGKFRSPPACWAF